MSPPETSIVIRTKNEGEIFNKVLFQLAQQSYQNSEIIIVDDNSIDGTDKLAYKYFPKQRVKIVRVPLKKFTHPFSCNLGANAAIGQYLVYLNGHSIPITKTWLEDGLKNFSEQRVAGIFSATLANPSANIIERIIYFLFSKVFNSRRKICHKTGTGILATTNAILRKDLWDKHHFNEKYVIGGEDGEWAGYWLKKGYVVIHDPKFQVYHSHNLSLLGLLRQYLRWMRMAKPSEGLKPYSFRKL